VAESGQRTNEGERDRALLALLLACGLRRHEAANLRVEDLQQREDHWAIVDLVGKGRHVRTVPMPDWVYAELHGWLRSPSIDRGKVFRRVSRTGRVLGDGISEKAIGHVVRSSASKVGVPALAPHDLRRTCARLCRNAGGELDQIQLLLGHVSIQTTEQYPGSRQRIRSAVNDRIDRALHRRKRCCTGEPSLAGSNEYRIVPGSRPWSTTTRKSTRWFWPCCG
jgi:integrase